MDITEPSFAAGEPSARAAAQREALQPGTRLGDFEIVRTLGTGGFGTVYLARDRLLERDVAVKEYLPAQLAYRAEGLRIAVRTPAVEAAYAAGLRSFVNEAKILARFNHPAVVKVHGFWEANGTAYMVMPWVRGPTLREVRRAMKSPPTEAWLRGMMDPLLDALAMLHAQGIYHRDIAPDNILLPAPDEPVLLDFGAARRVIGDCTQTITAVLKPSFAPIEQYAEASQLRQGPWTDLYALGAVVIYMMTAVPPPPSTVRSVQDELPLATDPPPPGVSASFLAAIHWALAVRPRDRPQSVQELRNALDGLIAPPPREVPREPAERLPAPELRRTATGWGTGADPIAAEAAAPAGEAAARHAATAERAAFAPPADDLWLGPLPGDSPVAPGNAAERDAPAGTAWDPTIRLVPAPLPALPRLWTPRRPTRRLALAGACVGGVAMLAAAFMLGGPVDPAPETWRALGRHAVQWNDAHAVEEIIEEPVPAAVAAAPASTVPALAAAAPASEAPAPAVRPVAATGSAGDARTGERTGERTVERTVERAGLAGALPGRALDKRSVASHGARKPKGGARARAAAVAERPGPGPREACGDRSFFGMAICINRQCESPRFMKHPYCVDLRRHWEERRMRGEHP